MSLGNRAGRKEVFFRNPSVFYKTRYYKREKTNLIAQNATGSINNIP